MSKLTLTVDPEVVKQAKVYAASQQQSLSNLVENFLKSLPKSEESEEIKLHGVVAELSGVIKEKDLADLDHYEVYLQEKYQ
ncbi:MAG: DUF6364 family protein [Endozoicomonas sp.]|uniref:DUF6364 family protein n=1 Tax=Endozoicomonas sp. TaxID=1892382 RepID=UPI003D9B729E